MTISTRTTGANRVPCDICQREIPRSEALVPEAGDYVVFFCGLECYGKWKSQLASPEERAAPARAAKEERPGAPPPEIQLGRGRGVAQDERVKQVIKRHPQRDEPLLDSVERDETPPS